MDVIYLNGASSSGKSSLAKELQNLLVDNYLCIGIDTLIAMMPEKANCLNEPSAYPCDGFSWQEVRLPNDKQGMRVVSGAYGKQINLAFHNIVKTLLEGDHKLIIDDVADGINEFAIWQEELSHYSYCAVGVYCSLAELQNRERARGDRKMGSAAEQFYRVHTGIRYDITINTETHTLSQCAEKIIDYISTAAKQHKIS